MKRPLLIVTGFMDPGIAALSLQWRLGAVLDNHRIATVSLGECMTFDACRDKIIAVTDREFPSDDPLQTTEVDVVGYSMGGLAARYAALPAGSPAERRLRIAHLFTISTPHRGADVAQRLPLMHPLQQHMRPGSALLARVNESKSPFPIVPYVRLGDDAIGESNAAPPGQRPWWVANEPFSDAHNGAYGDTRILADVARRLRGEPPLTIEPPAPIPSAKENSSGARI